MTAEKRLIESQTPLPIVGRFLGQKSQDYGSTVKNRAKRRLKTLYEVYLPVLMVQADFR